MIENIINQFVSDQKLAQAIDFFVYDSVKIIFLVFAVIFAVAFVRTFFPADAIKKISTKNNFGLGNLAAALFGAVTPFCSCSSIPIFAGFLKAGVPLGVAFSFLITSPLVNEVILVMMGGLFGWKIAILYAGTGILLGVLSGIILGKLKLEKEILIFQNNNVENKEAEYLPKTFSGKVQFSLGEAVETVKKLWWIILIGMAVGAFIHGYVPQTIFTQYLMLDSWLAVPIVTLIGVPIYAGCSTMVPIIFAMTVKGVPLGIALAFLMSTAGLSLPEAIILKRIMSLKLLVIFFSIVAVGVMIVGYLFNAIS